MFKVSKSLLNPRTVWTLWNSCCPAPAATCCVEQQFRETPPSGGGVLRPGSTFPNQGNPLISESVRPR